MGTHDKHKQVREILEVLDNCTEPIGANLIFRNATTSENLIRTRMCELEECGFLIGFPHRRDRRSGIRVKYLMMPIGRDLLRYLRWVDQE